MMAGDDAGARMRALAAALAPLLGAGWRIDPERLDYSWAAFLIGPDGELLRVEAPQYAPAGKVTVCAYMPDGSRDVIRYDENQRHEIGVSESRGPAVIAREITRRLLPAYREQLAEVRERMTRQATAADKRGKVVESLALNFMGSTSSHRPDEVRFGHGNRDYYGSVAVRHNAEAVDLEIHGLPIALARKVARILATADGAPR